jgi:hypothetical protein
MLRYLFAAILDGTLLKKSSKPPKRTKLALTLYREHLYQQHRQPSYCERCLTVFENSESLKDHVNKSVPCLPVISESSACNQGINTQQEVFLQLAGVYGGVTKTDKWNRIYRVLFPEVSEIPDPCMTSHYKYHSD